MSLVMIAGGKRVATFESVTVVAALIEESLTLANAKNVLLWPVRPGSAMATAIVGLLALSLTMTFASIGFGGPTTGGRWYTSKLFVWLALLAPFTWVAPPSMAPPESPTTTPPSTSSTATTWAAMR